MTDNLKIWERFADIDPKFTKSITGKSYKGTSPNPQYVIRCLTEIFGPVGQGFGWRVLSEEFTPLGQEVLHWCRIEFWHTDRANTFESYGQTKAAYGTSSGKFMVDEDAPKKSLTDAIVKAASHIGIAANIFLGRWDDSKYLAEVNAEYRAAEGGGPKADPKKHDAKQDQPKQRDWNAVSREMLAALKRVGPGVSNDPAFKRDLDALRRENPELAAQVEADIETRLQERSAA